MLSTEAISQHSAVGTPSAPMTKEVMRDFPGRGSSKQSHQNTSMEKCAYAGFGGKTAINVMTITSERTRNHDARACHHDACQQRGNNGGSDLHDGLAGLDGPSQWQSVANDMLKWQCETRVEEAKMSVMKNGECEGKSRGRAAPFYGHSKKLDVRSTARLRYCINARVAPWCCAQVGLDLHLLGSMQTSRFAPGSPVASNHTLPTGGHLMYHGIYHRCLRAYAAERTDLPSLHSSPHQWLQRELGA